MLPVFGKSILLLQNIVLYSVTGLWLFHSYIKNQVLVYVLPLFSTRVPFFGGQSVVYKSGTSITSFFLHQWASPLKTELLCVMSFVENVLNLQNYFFLKLAICSFFDYRLLITFAEL